METKKEKQTKAKAATEQATKAEAKTDQEPKKLGITLSTLKEALERVNEERIQKPLYSQTLMLARANDFWPNIEKMLNLQDIFRWKGCQVGIGWVHNHQYNRPEIAFITPNIQVLLMAIHEEIFSLSAFNKSAGKLDRVVSLPTVAIESTIRALSILAIILTLIIDDERWRVYQQKEKQKENKSK